jgi:hypothetical protein
MPVMPDALTFAARAYDQAKSARSRLTLGCILTMMSGGKVETIFGFEKEDDAL